MSDDKAKKGMTPDEAAQAARDAELQRQADQAEAVRQAGLGVKDGGDIPESVSFQQPGLGK